MVYKRRMTRIIPIARILLGLVFVTFSVNYFVPFLPQPKNMPADAMAFGGAFVMAGYMTFIKVIELLSGLALLANRFTTLALALLAPIIVGITIFHVKLEPAGLPIAIFALVLELFLAWAYRAAYRPMLAARVAPTVGSEPEVAAVPALRGA
jgi:drug/metabolite transporter (DMT)-like permease